MRIGILYSRIRAEEKLIVEAMEARGFGRPGATRTRATAHAHEGGPAMCGAMLVLAGLFAGLSFVASKLLCMS